jgi:3-hydroxyacyl-[acyl-carrier-protein] dehydratase
MPVIALPFATDHPVFPGHFPGRPIIPGVLLLDWAQIAVEALLSQRMSALTEAKFHSPATPADTLELDVDISTTTVQFEIRSAARKIASGRFALPPIAAP